MKTTKKIKNLDKIYEEIKEAFPLYLNKDGSVRYENYEIKKTANVGWKLTRSYGCFSSDLGVFNLRSSALLAAKFHKFNQIKHMLDISMLDQSYWKHYSDSMIFDHLYNKSSDRDRKQLYLWRLGESRSRSLFFKKKIYDKFHSVFR
jgi:hypothetical protein